ncbi:MAG: mechanosensitive ion channel [Oscillospiraceae bacterium]|nr:mechanosensitive ion channel [Oscillospiraceae bacterium]
MNWDKIKAFFTSLTLEKILPGLLILVVGIIVVRLILRLLNRALDRSHLDKTAFTIVKAVVKVGLYLLVILIAAGSLGIDVTSLIALLSVVSLAVSLAVQNVLSNVVGGVTLLGSDPFHVGDYVMIGADSGIVKEIGLQYTKIQGFNGEVIYIPNSEVVSSRVCNYTVEGKRRVELKFSADYDSSMDLVKETILASAQHPKILQEPAPEVVVSEYAASSVDYLLRVWVKAEDFGEVKFYVMEQAKRNFDAAGISIPYPQMDVHLKHK